MLKYTTNTLNRTEQLFKDAGFTVRYEKGNFTSGYCVLQNQKAIIINRFFTTEARINCLIEILATLDIREEVLSEDRLQFYKKLIHISAGV